MHQSYLFNVTIDCTDLDKNVEFWTKALNKAVAMRHGESFVLLQQDSGEKISIGLQKVDDVKNVKSRIHFDINTDNVEAEVKRLSGLGATEYAQHERWTVMQDPSGNEFCVVSYWSDDAAKVANNWDA